MTTTTPNFLDQSLGELATNLAGATRVFRQYKLDFCCGGHQTLKVALAKKGIDEETVLDQLEALSTEPSHSRHWQNATKAELIDHIYEQYHQRHRQQLPELIRLARRIEAVHGERPECPVGLADHLAGIYQEMESHMMKEEQILFPLLKKGLIENAQGPITVMQMEHDQHGIALDHLLDLTDNLTPPKGACNTWRALYASLEAFRNDLMEHIHLENNILFKA